MTDKIYNRLKYTAQVFLPAFTAFYLSLGEIWGFPYQVQVGATFASFNVFLGLVLMTSAIKYNKAQPSSALGSIFMEDDEDDGVGIKLDLGDPTVLQDGQKVYMIVNRPGLDPSKTA